MTKADVNAVIVGIIHLIILIVAYGWIPAWVIAAIWQHRKENTEGEFWSWSMVILGLIFAGVVFYLNLPDSRPAQ